MRAGKDASTIEFWKTFIRKCFDFRFADFKSKPTKANEGDLQRMDQLHFGSGACQDSIARCVLFVTINAPKYFTGDTTVRIGQNQAGKKRNLLDNYVKECPLSKWTRLGGTLFEIGKNCNAESWKVRNSTSPPPKELIEKLRNKGKHKKGTPTLGGEGLEKKLVTRRKKTSSRSQPVQINFIVQGLHIIVGKTYLVWHPETGGHSHWHW
jgi:hypothetical protein